MNYHHLTQAERDQLAVWRSQGLSLRRIARRLGRSHSSLSREVARNYGSDDYYPHTAQRNARQRLALSHRSPRLKNPALRQEVWRLLEQKWSPELIAGHLPLIRPELPSISHEAIYQWIYRDRRDLIRCLTRSHSKRGRRKSYRKRRLHIPRRVSVRKRPWRAQKRLEPGHWETDLLVGPGQAALQVSVERQSRYSLLRRIPIKSAGHSRAALTRLMSALPPALRRSITYDNGPENVEHHVLNDDFGMRSYFCEPYHSWEKGTVENTNGLIRRFIPKRTAIESLSEASIVQLENWLNDRPRKVLGFQTPRAVFQAFGALAG